MNLLLIAHGTRRPGGVAMIADLAERVGAVVNRPLRVAFVDVLGPSPAQVLRSLPPGPAVAVPAFLSSGYHVRTDIPAHIAESARPDVTVTAALGPSPEIVRIIIDGLLESGWCPGDSVVLAAAGTSDPHAQRDLRATAAMLSAALDSPTQLAYAATGTPRVADAVAALRARGARRVVVASYLLADGLFQDRLNASGADIVTPPLDRHPGIVALIARRVRQAGIPVAA